MLRYVEGPRGPIPSPVSDEAVERARRAVEGETLVHEIEDRLAELHGRAGDRRVPHRRTVNELRALADDIERRTEVEL